MKMNRLSALAIVCAAALPLMGNTETVGGYTWTYRIIGGTASLGSGSYPGDRALPKSTTGAITIPSSLGGHPVTSIGDYAFEGCRGLSSAVIPDSVTNIGQSAFSSCAGLRSVQLGNSVVNIGDWAFARSGIVGALTIPSSVINIGSSAFENCAGLASVTLPESVIKIGSYAFRSGSGLMSITVDAGNVNYSSSNGLMLSKDGKKLIQGINGDVIIPDSVTSIEFCAFDGCSGLRSVLIGNSVVSIRGYAFKDCRGLANLTVPDSVTSIEGGAFNGCTGLADNDGFIVLRNTLYGYCGTGGNVTIPDSVTCIGNLAFGDCKSLTSVLIPDSVTNIEFRAFYGCSNLACVTIPDSVISIGSGAFNGCSGLTSLTIPDSVTSIGFLAFEGCNDALFDTTTVAGVKLVDGWVVDTTAAIGGDMNLTGVRGIGQAFSNCSGLTSVTIGDNVKVIGALAFYGCNNLINVTIGIGVKNIGERAFSDCNKLTNLTIGAGVETIGDRAFYGCYDLTDVVIGDSVMNIGQNAFYNCGSVKNVTVPQYVCAEGLSSVFMPPPNGGITNVVISGSVTSIGKSAFEGWTTLKNVSIPNSVTNIGARAFYDCGGLDNMTIPDSVTSIGDKAFYYCLGLRSLKISDSVERIGLDAFSACPWLTSVMVPQYVCTKGLSTVFPSAYLKITNVVVSSSVTNIGANAFKNCSGLTDVTIGDGVTAIGNMAFGDCSNLTSVHIADLAKWCGISFASSTANPLWYAQNICLNGEIVKELVIPEGVTDIAPYAFTGCTSLTSVTFPDSLKSIGSYALQECSSLKSVTIPDSVTDIGYYAFGWCSALERVTIPGSVKIIANQAFKYCSGLTEVTIGDGVTRIGQDAFYGCSSLVDVTIPDSVTSIYMDAFTSCNEGLYDTTTIPGVKLVDGWAVGKTVSPVGNLNLAGARGIASGAFRNCSGLTSVTIPDGVKAIDDSAFDDCSALTFVTISDSVKRMGYGVFTGCNEALFDTTTIPGVKLVDGWAVGHTDSLAGTVDLTGVRGIGCSAFFGCGDMTGVVIPSSVKGIGQDAFTRCDSLTTIYVDSGDVERVKKLFEESWKDTSAFTFMELVATPVITPGDGSAFDDDKCTVAIACGTEGASIYYSTNGVTPRASAQYLYSGPFEIDGTVQIVAFAMKNGSASEYAEAAITKVVTPLTLALALDEEKLGEIATGGDAEWTPQRDAGAKAGKSVARSGAVGMNQETWLETTVRGKGTLTFWWKTSCEADPRGRHTYDHLTFSTAEGELYWLDGDSGWQQRSVTFDTDGDHTVRWTYSTDDWEEPGYQNSGWVDGVVWTGAASSGAMPSVVGDSDAVVTGDGTDGFVVRPSAGVDDVEVVIPDGISASMVIVEVPTTANSVTANGADVKIVKISGEERYDITKYLAMPDSAGGRIDVSKIEVQQKYADQVLDFAKGARFDLDAVNPITTARTEPGLTYILMEGRTLDSMKEGDSKVGDGNVWTPRVSVKGGSSGFYKIKVVK